MKVTITLTEAQIKKLREIKEYEQDWNRRWYPKTDMRDWMIETILTAVNKKKEKNA